MHSGRGFVEQPGQVSGSTARTLPRVSCQHWSHDRHSQWTISQSATRASGAVPHCGQIRGSCPGTIGVVSGKSSIAHPQFACGHRAPSSHGAPEAEVTFRPLPPVVGRCGRCRSSERDLDGAGAALVDDARKRVAPLVEGEGLGEYAVEVDASGSDPIKARVTTMKTSGGDDAAGVGRGVARSRRRHRLQGRGLDAADSGGLAGTLSSGSSYALSLASGITD